MRGVDVAALAFERLSFRQLGHSNAGITSIYLQGIDSGEITETVHARRGDDPRKRHAAALIECERAALLVARTSSDRGAFTQFVATAPARQLVGVLKARRLLEVHDVDPNGMSETGSA